MAEALVTVCDCAHSQSDVLEGAVSTCMVMGGRYHTLTTMAQLVIVRSR